jgi:DNA-binding beta-propeller fold protein YncE
MFVIGLLAMLTAAAPAGASSVYVSDTTSGTVSVFGIGATGALTPVACGLAVNCETGDQPLGVAIDPSGADLYAVNSNAASVSVFSIGAGGGLTTVACDPAVACKTGTAPFGVAVDPTGRYVYVTSLIPPSVSVYAIGAGGALTPVACDPATVCKTGASPEALAVDPTGRYVYVDNEGGASVSVFAIGAGGALTPVVCDPTTACKTGSNPTGIAATPDGRYVYVTNQGSDSVSVFAIGVGGALSPVICDSATICETGSNPQTAAVDPSGSHLYVVNGAPDNSVSVFAIGSGGVLAPVACDPTTVCQTGAGPKGIAVDPIGEHVYVSNFSSSTVSAFTIGADGSLSPIPCVPATSCQTGDNPDLFSLAISPDRGPAAAFVAGPGTAGSASQFDASSSSSPDYPVASYAWDFGDGHTQTGTNAVVTHTYASPGVYTVTLGEVDQAGCSTAVVFTGQTASCNGSAKADATRTITVMSPVLAPVVPPTLVPAIAVVSKLKVSPSAVASVRNGKRRAGADVSYTLNVAASVRFTVQRRSSGRKVKHGKKITCDRATKRNHTKTSCVRYTTLRGSFTRASQAGLNTFRFTGRFNAKRLARGSYRLVASPTANGKRGLTAIVAFRIIR